MSFKSMFAVAAVAFAGLTRSHMIMQHPVPYGKATLDTSPIDANGDNYPCKQRSGVYDITQMNNMAVGEPQLLEFEGSASHDGGTCQMAVTLDKEPTKDSQFKIIQVFEGGCPTSGSSGAQPFTFVIPKDFPNGQATLAWVWYNKVGNREMYMNCAPITVTGGSDGQDYYNSLPNLYIINMPTDGTDVVSCTSSYQGLQNSVTIPNPGQFILRQPAGQDLHAGYGPGNGCKLAADAQLKGVMGYQSKVITDNGAAYAAPGGSGGVPPLAPSGGASYSAAPSGGASSAAPSGGASYGPAPSGGASDAPSGSAAAPSSQAAASSAPAYGSSAPSGSAAAPSGSVAAPSGGASSYAAPSSAAAAPSSQAAASSAPAYGSGGAAPSGFATSGGGYAAPSGGASNGSCSSSNAALSCSSDGKQFGVCSNSVMVWRDVAAGTTCSGGTIQKRSQYGHRHVRRHARNAWNGRS